MMKMIICAGCDKPILDRYLLNISDQSWHPRCVKCCKCNEQLEDRCFSREGKLFCRKDYFTTFGTKCSGCKKGILPSDLVRRARSHVFHMDCFSCQVCRKPSVTGEELYILDDNRFICKEDFVNSRHHHQSSDLDDSESNLKFEDEDREDDDRCDDELMPGSPSSNQGLGPAGASAHLPHHHHHSNHHHHHNHHHNHHQHHHHSLFPGSNGVSGGGGGGNGGNSLAALSSKSSPLSASSSLSDSGHGITGGTGTDSMCASSPPSNIGSNSNGPAGMTTTTNLSGAEDNSTPGTKRRGPRTTIKAKQLETLKAAFAATPKPTRHIRESLANETGLNMRVIQVWFQNRRSKERRMKQLNVMGSRRHFFRSPRRAMRPLRPGLGSHDDLGDSPDMVGGPGNAFGYFSESSNPGDFGYPPQGPPHPGAGGPGQPPGGYPFDFYGLPSAGTGGAGNGPPPPGSLYHPHGGPDGPGSVEQGLPGSLGDGSGMGGGGGWPPQTQISPDDLH